MDTAAHCLRRHPYKLRQAAGIIRVALHLVFTYSSSLTAWNTQALKNLGKQWGLMGHRAWRLTDGHNEAPFILPPEMGGLQMHSPTRLAAKAAVSLTERMLKTQDREIPRLANGEMQLLQDKWGTKHTREIQQMIMMEDTAPTLISRSLFYTGLVGTTPHWNLSLIHI